MSVQTQLQRQCISAEDNDSQGASIYNQRKITIIEDPHPRSSDESVSADNRRWLFHPRGTTHVTHMSMCRTSLSLPLSRFPKTRRKIKNDGRAIFDFDVCPVATSRPETSPFPPLSHNGSSEWKEQWKQYVTRLIVRERDTRGRANSRAWFHGMRSLATASRRVVLHARRQSSINYWPWADARRTLIIETQLQHSVSRFVSLPVAIRVVAAPLFSSLSRERLSRDFFSFLSS